MTQVDDAVDAARQYMKAAEDVLAAFRVLSPQHKTQLQTNFPTLATSLSMFSLAHKPLDGPPK